MKLLRIMIQICGKAVLKSVALICVWFLQNDETSSAYMLNFNYHLVESETTGNNRGFVMARSQSLDC